MSIVDKAAFGEGEAAIMVARETDNAEGLVPLHRYVYDLLKCFTVRRTRLRDCEALSAYRGYGISNQEEGCCVREAVARHRLGVIDLGGYLASLFDADNQLIA